MLYVPQGKEDYPNFGKVLAVGGEVEDILVGDYVAFKRKPASAISPEAREKDEFYGLLVLPEDHILAIVEAS